MTRKPARTTRVAGPTRTTRSPVIEAIKLPPPQSLAHPIATNTIATATMENAGRYTRDDQCVRISPVLDTSGLAGANRRAPPGQSVSVDMPYLRVKVLLETDATAGGTRGRRHRAGGLDRHHVGPLAPGVGDVALDLPGGGVVGEPVERFAGVGDLENATVSRDRSELRRIDPLAGAGLLDALGQ